MTEQEKSLIRSLIQSSQWSLIQKLSDEYIAHIRNYSSLKDTEWETLKSVISQESKVEGIKGFIQEIFKQSQ